MAGFRDTTRRLTAAPCAACPCLLQSALEQAARRTFSTGSDINAICFFEWTLSLRLRKSVYARRAFDLRKHFERIGARSGVQQETFQIIAAILIPQQRDPQLEHARLGLRSETKLVVSYCSICGFQCRPAQPAATIAAPNSNRDCAMAPFAYSRIARSKLR